MMSNNERLRSIPVIVLTGNSDQQTIRRCHNMMVYYVQKKSADVWKRIEPLLIELIGNTASTPARTGSQSNAEPSTIKYAAPQNHSPVNRSDTEERGDDLLDAVFAILGETADECSPSAANFDADSPADASLQEPPWVLCIDDDTDFSDALKCRLETFGVAVIRAFNGMEGYRLAFTNPPKAILLDYHMPNGHGDYVFGRLKENPVTKEIPVIIITGVRDKWLERKMFGLGAAGFLNKPVQFSALRDELANFIDILAEPAAV